MVPSAAETQGAFHHRDIHPLWQVWRFFVQNYFKNIKGNCSICWIVEKKETKMLSGLYIIRKIEAEICSVSQFFKKQ